MNARSIMCWVAVAVAAIAAAIAATPLNDIPGTTEVYSAAETDAAITAATNSIKVDEADFTPSNAVLVATIEEVAPPPGNYETVSNRAMGAVQSLQPAYYYADAALGAFAETGSVARATTYGTPTRLTDATGCVWEVRQVIGPWSFSGDGMEFGVTYSVEIAGESPPFTYLLLKNGSLLATTSGEDEVPMSIRFVGTDYDSPEPIEFDIVASRSYQSASNLVGRVALTNDIPPAVTVVAPSTNATAGTAADAKDTGIALYTGFTAWVFSPSELESGWRIKSLVYEERTGWTLTVRNDAGPEEGYSSLSGTAEETYLEFHVEYPDYLITATRHLITPTKTSQLKNDGSNGVPFVAETQLGTKQDTLPYPTNAIPYAVISGQPSLAGQTFDFSRNYDIIRATAAIAEALGATVTNNPTTQGDN